MNGTLLLNSKASSSYMAVILNFIHSTERHLLLVKDKGPHCEGRLIILL
jgi:hypothetical protein